MFEKLFKRVRVRVAPRCVNVTEMGAMRATSIAVGMLGILVLAVALLALPSAGIVAQTDTPTPGGGSSGGCAADSDGGDGRGGGRAGRI